MSELRKTITPFILSGRFRDILAIVISTGFLSGFLPKSPGTWGSLAALGFWFGFNSIFTPNVSLNIALAVFTLVLGTITTNVCLNYEKRSSVAKSTEITGKHDPQYIVIDEWCGLFTALIITSPEDIFEVLVAFVLFRAFDIFKPLLVHRAESLPGSLGVMLDDVVAGGYAFIVLHTGKLLLFFLGTGFK